MRDGRNTMTLSWAVMILPLFSSCRRSLDYRKHDWWRLTQDTPQLDKQLTSICRPTVSSRVHRLTAVKAQTTRYSSNTTDTVMMSQTMMSVKNRLHSVPTVATELCTWASRTWRHAGLSVPRNTITLS